MRTVVHLSDLHFGRTDDTLLDPLVSAIRELAPDVITVSGDLTQRARSAQFQAARVFIDSLAAPKIIVPGNHDVPLWNVFRRFFRPLDSYRRYITDDLQPYYADEEIALLGINTARSLTFKGGRINPAQIAAAQQRLCSLPAEIVKVIVTHHPFDLPPGFDSNERVGRAKLAMDMLFSCRCDLLLAGHLHVSEADITPMRFVDREHGVIIVQAGTATSTRARGETNSFNAIAIERQRIEVRRHAWVPTAGAFQHTSSETFARTVTGWRQVGVEEHSESSAPPTPGLS
jgi:3',5'-cyclic AMP phosphodiesterase CpdA